MILMLASSNVAFAQSPVESVYQYIFGHSLINWYPHDIPQPYPPLNHTSTPYWVYQFATSAGLHYAVDGRFGFHPDYVRDWPPHDGWGFDGVPVRREGPFDFATAGFDNVMFTAMNFAQWRRPHEPLPWDGPGSSGPSMIEYSIQLIDQIRDLAGPVPILIYENWPDMGAYWQDTGSINRPIPPTEAELAAYYEYALGDFQDWWLELHDGIRARRPAVYSIPVGGIMMRLLSETVLREIPPLELFYDPAPHGTPNLYFLAAMVHYTAMFNAPVPTHYRAPAHIHPLIRENMSFLNDFIRRGLHEHVTDDGTSRVFASAR